LSLRDYLRAIFAPKTIPGWLAVVILGYESYQHFGWPGPVSLGFIGVAGAAFTLVALARAKRRDG